MMGSDSNFNNDKNKLSVSDCLVTLLVFAVAALTSHSRAAEIPFAILAIVVPLLNWRQWPELWSKPAIRLLLLLFACYWLPMVLALPDAVYFEKSLTQSLVALRFPLGAIGILLLLNKKQQLLLIYRLLAVLIVFWALDALFQQWVGVDFFGLPDQYPRLSGIFASDYLRLGLYSALFLPFLLHSLMVSVGAWLSESSLSRRNHKKFPLIALLTGLGLLLVFVVILLSGTRSGWIIAGIAVIGAILPIWWRRKTLHGFWVYSSIALLLIVLSLGASYVLVPEVQERVQQTTRLVSGDFAAVNEASSFRLPIWQHAWTIATAHPINGVGPRGFRIAYEALANEDDYFLQKEGGGASHAHQLQLSIATETGLIGLLGFVVGTLLLWRSWTVLPERYRCYAAPVGLALFSVVFPFNSHLDAYASSAALIFWWLVGIYLTAWQLCQEEPC